jgi:Na+-driven multidrug efflux pump
MSLRSTMQLVLVGLVAGFGDSALAAYGGAGRLQGIGYMTVFGISAASATLVGQNLGAGKPDRAQRSAVVAVGMALAFMGAFAATAFVLAPQILGLLGGRPIVIEIGTGMLRITALGFLFAAVGIVLSRSLGGAGDTVPPMVITLVGLWAVQVPLAYVLAKFTTLGVTGVWIAYPVTGFVLASMTSVYFFTGRWKRKKV